MVFVHTVGFHGDAQTLPIQMVSTTCVCARVEMTHLLFNHSTIFIYLFARSDGGTAYRVQRAVRVVTPHISIHRSNTNLH